ECLEYDSSGDPIPIEHYKTERTGVAPTWAKMCGADFNIRQTAAMGNVNGLEEDPVTHDILATDWAHGIATVIRPKGSGETMTFEVGNLARTTAQATSLETHEGPCALVRPGDPE